MFAAYAVGGMMGPGTWRAGRDPRPTGFLRLTIDGVEQSPGEVPAIAPEDRGTHGFNWQSKPLTPGSHTVRVQWRTDLGGTLCADARSLIVLHK